MRGDEQPRIPPDVVDRIRARFDISAVADRLGLKTKRVGHEYVGICPFHKERTPSWKLNDAKGFAHCFGCGSNHDTIALVRAVLGLGFVDALRWLDSSELPPVEPIVRQEQEEACRAERLEAIQDARRFACEGVPVTLGDPVWTYLKARGLSKILPPYARLPITILFGNVPKWRDLESKEWGPALPCMACVAQDGAGKITGIQRVHFHRNDPALGKADKPKRSLGAIRGSPGRLGRPARHINLAEGPEDALSAWEMMPERPAWCAFGTSQMPFATFPPEVEEVTLLGQNNAASMVAIAKAGPALLERGLTCGSAFPPSQYGDWNDLLRGEKL